MNIHPIAENIGVLFKVCSRRLFLLILPEQYSMYNMSALQLNRTLELKQSKNLHLGDKTGGGPAIRRFNPSYSAKY